ncbi:unnamed protein product [Urochloa decumbens]|uniref:Uncharacterized protein n=1 Tax=Urochloa decumbens TaxID=240449 RepID=A0ABC8Z1I0_9POAL
MHYDQDSVPLLSQLSSTMVSQMVTESSQSRSIGGQPLPDSAFILSNIPAERPLPPTTATKMGRARATKRKEAPTAPKKATTTKKAKAPKKGASGQP